MKPMGHRVRRVLGLYPFFGDPLLQASRASPESGNPVFSGFSTTPSYSTMPPSVQPSSIPSITRSSRCRFDRGALGLALLLNMKRPGAGVLPNPVLHTVDRARGGPSLIFVWIFPAVLRHRELAAVRRPRRGPGLGFFSIAWSKPTFILLGLWGARAADGDLPGRDCRGCPKEMYEVAALEGAGRGSGCTRSPFR